MFNCLVSVLVVALVYRRSKMENNNCDQFSDIMSTTSRSTASTISSTRSSKSVPDKIDIISFNAEGNLRKSVKFVQIIFEKSHLKYFSGVQL